MCLNENGHRTVACMVGDLKPGQQYRTPEGETLLVVGVCEIAEATVDPEEDTLTVCIETGVLRKVPNTTKLGHDRRDRLYASRSLNPAPKQVQADEPLSVDAEVGL